MRKPLHQLHEDDIHGNESGKRWLDLVRSHVLDIREATFAFNPASLAANTNVEETVTVNGLKVDDIVLAVIKPTFTQGFHVGQGRVSAAHTLAIQIANGTGSSANPAEETYRVIYIKNSKI